MHFITMYSHLSQRSSCFSRIQNFVVNTNIKQLKTAVSIKLIETKLSFYVAKYFIVHISKINLPNVHNDITSDMNAQ